MKDQAVAILRDIVNRTQGYLATRLYCAPRTEIEKGIKPRDSHEFTALNSAHKRSELMLFGEDGNVFAIVKCLSGTLSSDARIGIKGSHNCLIMRGNTLDAEQERKVSEFHAQYNPSNGLLNGTRKAGADTQ